MEEMKAWGAVGVNLLPSRPPLLSALLIRAKEREELEAGEGRALEGWQHVSPSLSGIEPDAREEKKKTIISIPERPGDTMLSLPSRAISSFLSFARPFLCWQRWKKKKWVLRPSTSVWRLMRRGWACGLRTSPWPGEGWGLQGQGPLFLFLFFFPPFPRGRRKEEGNNAGLEGRGFLEEGGAALLSASCLLSRQMMLTGREPTTFFTRNPSFIPAETVD
jgi:hypothetical protein